MSDPDRRSSEGDELRMSDPDRRSSEGDELRMSDPDRRSSGGDELRMSDPDRRSSGGDELRMSDPDRRSSGGDWTVALMASRGAGLHLFESMCLQDGPPPRPRRSERCPKVVASASSHAGSAQPISNVPVCFSPAVANGRPRRNYRLYHRVDWGAKQPGRAAAGSGIHDKEDQMAETYRTGSPERGSSPWGTGASSS